MLKTKPSFEFQNNLLKNITDINQKYIIGIDEVGRGPLAGDVFACAVYINENNFSDHLLNKIDDSKKISELKRENLFEEFIDNKNIHYGIGRVSVEVIDKINILQATFIAMKEAYENLRNKLSIGNDKTFVLVDGNIAPFKDINNIKCIVKGDSLSISIATASIIAKVTRDRYMRELSKQFPEYRFDKNKGYGTKSHIEAIKKFGFCKIHRKSFLNKVLKN